ncbi:hypothetical protein [Jiangella ureilytica]|uniref:hypothetical protein n=1 Tax=Jiangella ureilytica TaxID=2530374 RepID=UPI0013A5DACE|nr:hypothetical protein [Jiangella ureilytica]
MVFRTLTAGAFLVGAPPGATEPDAEPRLPPSSPSSPGKPGENEREPDAVAGEWRSGS